MKTKSNSRPYNRAQKMTTAAKKMAKKKGGSAKGKSAQGARHKRAGHNPDPKKKR